MEHWVALHRARKFKLVDVGADNPSDGEGAETTGVQLTAWSDGTEIRGIEPDLVAYVEIGGGYSVVVGSFLLSGLDVTYLGSDDIVNVR